MSRFRHGEAGFFMVTKTDSFVVHLRCLPQPYDLPNKATSWRCANCMEFNSITQGECEWCTVL
jgi:hypothetical protein